jgi:hypothetical protein
MQFQKHWRYALLLLPAMVLAIVVATAATAKDKPTTTTSTTTTTTAPPAVPTLGIPHVVELIESDTDRHAIVRCPEGEAAISWSFAWYNFVTGYDASPSTESVRPIVEDGRPVGYEFTDSAHGGESQHYYVTCAPVVT